MKIAIILTAMDKMSRVVDGAVSKVQKRLQSVAKVTKGLNAVGNVSIIGGSAIVGFLGSTVSAAEESEVAQNRLRQVFKSMGQDYVKATAQSEAYASKLQVQIGQEDELILAVQAKIATFEKAANAQARANGIYERATVAAFNMQAAGFGEASQNSVQLGKALQDPIKGIKALARSGITFTEAEQKKIKALIQSGKLFKAQDMVMKAIEKQVGGVAAATTTTSKKMRLAWGEVVEKLGTIVLPFFVKLGNYFLNNLIPRVQGFIDKHPHLVRWLAKAGVALIAFGVAAKILAAAISIVTVVASPIGAVIAAIAVAAFLVIRYWKQISGFFSRLWTNVKDVFFFNIARIKNFIKQFTPAIVIYSWHKLIGFFKSLWSGVKNVFRAGIEFIKIIINPFKLGAMLGGSFKSAFASIKNSLFQGGKNIVKAIWEGIKAAAVWPVNAIKGIVKKIRDFLPFSPAKTGPLKDIHRIKLVETIAASINAKPMMKAMEKLTGGIAGYGPSPRPQLATAGGGMSLTYAPVIHGADAANLATILRQHSKELMNMINEENRKRARKQF